MMLYLQRSDHGWSYQDRKGTLIKPVSATKCQIILGINHCPVLSLTLPPLKGKDRQRLIEEHLPSYFPVPLESYSWDTRDIESETLIFLVETSLLERIRQDWGHNVSIISPGQFIPRGKEKKQIFTHKSLLGTDLFLFNRGKMTHAVHGATRELIDEFAADLLENQNILHELDLSPLKKGLFTEERSFSSKAWMLLVLLPLLMMGIWAGPWKVNKKLEAQWQELEKQRSGLISREAEKVQEQLPWDTLLEQLQQNQADDVYNRIAWLRPFFENPSIILNLTIEGKEFLVLARGTEPLEILENLKNHPQIKEIILFQSREQEDQEIFNLSGRWK